MIVDARLVTLILEYLAAAHTGVQQIFRSARRQTDDSFRAVVRMGYLFFFAPS